jgi:hypothetical protein
MFEQSSQSYQYQYEPIAEPLKEGDPFYHYEIKNWELGPRIYKIIGLSAVLNIAVLVILGQTSLLTMKGCDSPLVATMCQALDTVYVGSMLFGTDREYVDAAYDKTDLGDVDITYVDVTGAENQKLYYPADYFQLANPEKFDPTTGEPIDQFANLSQQDIPGIMDNNGYPPPAFQTRPSTPGHSIFDTPQHLPQSNPNPIAGDLPGAGGNHTGSTPGPRRPRNGRPPRVNESNSEGTDPNEQHTAQAKPSPAPSVEPTEPVQAVTINREALKSYARGIAPKIVNKEVDITGLFKVEAVATLTRDGRMDTSIDPKTRQKRSRIISAAGDPNLAKTASDAIAAVGDSGWLGYLSNEKIEKVRFVFGQTDDKLIFTIFADQPPKGRSVESIANGLNVLKSGAKLLNLGEDEMKLLQAATITTKDKQLVFYFEMPKDVANEMMMRNIQKTVEEEQNKTNNAVTTATPANQTKN